MTARVVPTILPEAETIIAREERVETGDFPVIELSEVQTETCHCVPLPNAMRGEVLWVWPTRTARTVTESAPVGATFAGATLLMAGLSILNALVMDPTPRMDSSTVATVINEAAPRPDAGLAVNAEFDTQTELETEVPLMILTRGLTFAPAPKPLPKTVTLAAPVDGPLLQEERVTAGRSNEKARVREVVRVSITPTVATSEPDERLPHGTRADIEVSDNQTDPTAPDPMILTLVDSVLDRMFLPTRLRLRAPVVGEFTLLTEVTSNASKVMA